MSFQGFRAGTLPFLSDLAEHNERAWFEANRARWEADLLAPARELFSTLGPKARTQVGFLVDAACPAGTFDHPGVYRLVPVLDTRKASGAPLGMRTFDDVVWGTRATELRVRAGRRPDRRVALDPAS